MSSKNKWKLIFVTRDEPLYVSPLYTKFEYVNPEYDVEISDFDYIPTVEIEEEPIVTIAAEEPEILVVEEPTKETPKVSNLNKYLKMDIEDLLKARKITTVNGKKINFGNKNRRTSKIGSPNSWHRKVDPITGFAMARDITISGGTAKDYESFVRKLYADPIVKAWMQNKKWGFIDEWKPSVLARTRGTGPHIHLGPDTWAVRNWNHYMI